MEIFIIEREGKPHERFIKLDFDYVDMKKFAVENYEGKIFRKATNEEINKFLMAKETQKYNL